MPHQKARKALDDLHVELQRTPQDTGALERVLEQAKDELEDLTPEALKDLAETLRRESKEFGAEHPRVSAAINQVMHALSGLGI